MTVAPVNQAQFAPQLDILDGNQLDPACAHIIIGKALADQRDAQIRTHKTLDHGYAGQSP